MKLTDLDPHFVKLARPLKYDRTDDIGEADALSLRCPACHWSAGRSRDANAHVHTIMLWRPQPPLWWFEGNDYGDLSVMAGRIAVEMTTGCRACFTIRKGKVDFT